MQTTLNQILQKVFSTTNEEDIISTWFDEENQVIREQLMEMYEHKSSVETFSSLDKKNPWMSFEVYNTPKGKLLQQFGMPDSFWFLKKDVVIEEVKNSTKFKEGDITNQGKVEKAPTGDLLINGHHIDEYPELKLLEEVKDFSTFTKFRKDLIVAHIVGKTPGIKSAAIGKEMKSLGYTNFSYDDIYYTLQRVLKTLEKETK